MLADRKNRKHVSGYVLINGEKQPRNFKCAAGYVVQVCMICVYALSVHVHVHVRMYMSRI